MAVDSRNPGNRAKAFRLRKVVREGQTLQPEDQLWLASYEESATANTAAQRKNAGKNFGASRSGRRIKLDVEEHAEAVGVGGEAAAAAAQALAAREEGRRIDALSIGAVDALKEACAVYKGIGLSVGDRTGILEATHVQLLGAVRDHYVARTEAEVELQKQITGDDGANAMLMAVLAQHLGIPLPPGAFKAPPNGAPGRGKRPA